MGADPPRADAFVVGQEPIDVGGLLREVGAPRWGAVVSFVGSVRSPNAGVDVEHIDYEGYQGMMVSEMRRLVEELRQRHDLGRVLVSHRLGRLRPGEISLAAVVASEHRADALTALEELVEGLKARLPVWKYEVGPAGGGYVRGRADAAPTL